MAYVRPDPLAELLAFKWRDVEFPVTRMRVSIAHDLVEHKYWGVNGARVEATGLAPMRFSASIPLTNGIVPAKSERWQFLYPNTMLKLLVAFAKKATGILQHPEFGPIACKAEKIDLDWEGIRRGGCDAEASWVETNPDDPQATVAAAPVHQIDLAARDLDASSADLKKLVPEAPEYKESFEDFARQIQAIGDQVTLLSYRASGKINGILYRVQNVEDSIDRARSALTWPVKQNLERLKAAGHDLRRKLLEVGRDIVLYRVPGDTTLAGVAACIPDANIGDLVKLNPALMSSPEIRRGTMVRHYASPILH